MFQWHTFIIPDLTFGQLSSGSFRELGMASLPLAGQSVQPLLRQLACSVPVLPLEVELSLEMQVLMVGKMPDLQNSLSSAAHGLRKQSREGAVCSSHGLTHGTGQGGTGWVLTCSTRGWGCHLPVTLPLPKGDFHHCQLLLQWERGKWHGSTAWMAAWRAQHSVTACNACAQSFPAVPAPL